MAPVTTTELAELAGHGAVLISVAFLSSYFSLPSRIFDGITTYIHQDNINSGDGPRAAIRPPSGDNPNVSSDSPQLKRRSKGKSAFDESAAQLLRLRLVDFHLRSRVYFPEYSRCFVSVIAATCSLLLGFFLLKRIFRSDKPPSVASAGVPILASIIAVTQILLSVARIFFDRSAATRSERQIAVLSGFVGFVSVMMIRFVLSPTVCDFVGGAVGITETFTAALAGSVTVFLFLPAARSARSFWLGTDQLRWNLDFAVTGKISLILMYVAVIAGVVAPLMWIKPIVAFYAKNAAPTDFNDFRILLLAGSALMQFLIIRPNLQTYLNESVLSWYQMLHSSKIPNSDLARAKLFLHNHNICLVILQFFAPAAMEILLLGLSRTAASFPGDLASSAGEIALFLAWWISFVRAVFSIFTLVFLRCGLLIIS